LLPRLGAAGAALAALVALVGTWPAPASAAPAIRLTAGFAAGARLGAGTEMHAELRIDPRRLHAQLTGVRVLYPKGLGLVASGLGLASCTRPASDFQQVLIRGPKLGGCPPNAVLGYGTVEAQVRLLDGQIIPEYATATVLSGPFKQGVLGLVVFVDGQHPFGAKLAYAGELSGATGPFGGAIVVRMPEIPSIADLATLALTDMRLSIGSRRITYYKQVRGRSVPYHPDGIVLPGRCPKGGFRFRTQLAFQDGSHVRADATVGCARFAAAAGG
jgi:hypothetical protein